MSVEQVERLRVAWVDTDAGGRIHFTAAFRWAEVAETALIRRLSFIDGWGSFPRRHVEADFHKVLRFEDEIEVRLRVDGIETTSVTYAWTVSKDGDACVEGRHTVVHVDEEGRSEPLSDRVRAAFS
jgi:acyl-CoA thioester hydrolase